MVLGLLKRSPLTNSPILVRLSSLAQPLPPLWSRLAAAYVVDTGQPLPLDPEILEVLPF
jgi:hypothetical protein